MALDFSSLAARLLSQSRSILPGWFPAGRWQGAEYCVGNLQGDPGDSLKINADSGKWADFAAGEQGGDLISLYAALRGIKQGEALIELNNAHGVDVRPLSRAERKAQAPAAEKKREEWTPIVPAPDDAPRPTDDFYRRTPDAKEWLKLTAYARWPYHNAEGKLIGYAVRFEWIDGEERKKDILPQVYCAHSDGKRYQWRWRAFPQPRPLYNLPELAARPDAPVLLVEGEKKVEAVRKLAPQYVGIAWPGGCKAWKKVDFTPLAGRSILVWPDADEVGIKAMWEIAHHLLRTSATVKIILPEKDKPEGWDAADALAEGWDWAALKAWALPRVQLLTDGGTDASNTNAGRSSSTDAPELQQDVSQENRRAAEGRAEVAAPADVARINHLMDQAARHDSEGPGDREPDSRQPLDVDPGSAGGSRAGERDTQRGHPATGRADERVPAAARSGGTPPAAQASQSQGATPSSQVGRWIAWNLDRNGNGIPLTNLNNAVRVIESDPSLRGVLWFDDFLNRVMTGDPAREWTDADEINLTLYMQRELGVSKIGRDTVSLAVVSVASRDRRNCVRDWLDSLVHDGTPRIEHFMSDVFGAVESDYTMAASRNFWLSMVARVYKPGCKVDNMIVLEGAQGLYKSTALSLIAGEWFTEQHESATNAKAFAEILQGKLLTEVSEMDSFTRAEVTRVKQIVSCQSDRYRDSYGRHARDHPRQGIFVGTTNKDDWNRDETGARRMWPIACRQQADIEIVKTNREQLFAEAVARFKRGEPWWMMPEQETAIEQRKRYDADPWLGPVSSYVTGRRTVTTHELLIECLRFEVSKIGRADQMRVASCLRALGWVNRGNVRRAGKVIKEWEPGSDQFGVATNQAEDATEVATEKPELFQ